MEELVNKLNSLEGQFALPKFCWIWEICFNF
jgi:hypothetical protein